MKNLFFFIGLLLFAISIQSCKKSDDLPEDSTDNKQNNPPEIYDSIYAGIYDTTFVYHEFASPIVLNLIWEPSMLIGNAKDSFMINTGTDSIFIKFRLRITNPDSASTICLLDTFFVSYFSVAQEDSLDIYNVVKKYYVGLGATTSYTFAQALDIVDAIRSNGQWDTMFKWIDLWEMPTDVGMVSNYHGGPWMGVSVGYLGINYKGHMGWIKIDKSSFMAPKIISYAIKK